MAAAHYTIEVTWLGAWRYRHHGWCAAFTFSNEPNVIHLAFADE